ncbi:hypothetical protein ACFOVU_06890 [Nocardiopsis sediminis]|uniref:DUF748 domain-containing protein n=1 Tax=Nocardiopsis sediminis TaxID=1778267 RepID=A0ABV8FHQ1_9ACTN
MALLRRVAAQAGHETKGWMMNVPAKLGIYGLGLAVAFAGAVGAGTLAGPLLPAATAEGGHGSGAAADAEGGHGGHGGPAAGQDGAAAPVPSGLQISQDGYTLDPVDTPGTAGEEETLSFRILGPDGDPVTGFSVAHDKRMHLIVVGRDLAGFQHVHPEMADDGTWSIPMEPDTPGPYRMFADFVPEGRDDGLTLGADLAVPGDYEPEPLPEPDRTAEVDGYTVTLDGDLVAGSTSELTLTVTKDGEEVTDLEPYLAAYGHLVALRDGDLAYLHVHPEGSPGDGTTEPGPQITFQAEVPSTGDYRLYLDFQHDGEVRTAEFTATASADGAAAPGDDGGTGTSGGHTDGADDGAEHTH